MQTRNPIFTASGAIDCEIEHPTYGWIPFTASPDDVEEHGREIFEALKDSAAPYVPLPPDPAQVKEAFRRAVQAHIDATAQSRSYDNGMALAGYVNSAVPPWKAEAEAFIAWRDQVWLFVFEKLAQVEAGEVEAPSSPEALIGWLPQIEWPA
jgi:hypothetical protein